MATAASMGSARQPGGALRAVSAGCEQYDEAARIEQRDLGEVEVDVAGGDDRVETLAQLGCCGEIDLAGD
jgi:hypothetical protein